MKLFNITITVTDSETPFIIEKSESTTGVTLKQVLSQFIMLAFNWQTKEHELQLQIERNKRYDEKNDDDIPF